VWKILEANAGNRAERKVRGLFLTEFMTSKQAD